MKPTMPEASVNHQDQSWSHAWTLLGSKWKAGWEKTFLAYALYTPEAFKNNPI